jgi:hypothetical protein
MTAKRMDTTVPYRPVPLECSPTRFAQLLQAEGFSTATYGMSRKPLPLRRALSLNRRSTLKYRQLGTNVDVFYGLLGISMKNVG